MASLSTRGSAPTDSDAVPPLEQSSSSSPVPSVYRLPIGVPSSNPGFGRQTGRRLVADGDHGMAAAPQVDGAGGRLDDHHLGLTHRGPEPRPGLQLDCH